MPFHYYLQKKTRLFVSIRHFLMFSQTSIFKCCFIYLKNLRKASHSSSTLLKLSRYRHFQTREIPIDMTPNMKQTTRICSPAARRVTDCLHVQKLAYEAVQEMRVKAHWEALDEESIQMAYAQGIRKIYHDPVFETGIQGNSCWQEASISS